MLNNKQYSNLSLLVLRFNNTNIKTIKVSRLETTTKLRMFLKVNSY